MTRLHFTRHEDPRKRIQALRAYAELARPEDPELADRLWRVAEAEEARLESRLRDSAAA